MADNKKSTMPIGGGRGNRHAAPQKPKNTMATLKKLWKYISVHKVKLIIVFFLVLFTTLTTLISTRAVGTAIDNYVLPRNDRKRFIDKLKIPRTCVHRSGEFL